MGSIGSSKIWIRQVLRAAASGMVLMALHIDTVRPRAFVPHASFSTMTLTTRRCKSEEEIYEETIEEMIRGLKQTSNDYFAELKRRQDPSTPAENYEDVMLKMMERPDSGVRQWADRKAQKILPYLEGDMTAEANANLESDMTGEVNASGGTKFIPGFLSRRAHQLKQTVQKWLSKMCV